MVAKCHTVTYYPYQLTSRTILERLLRGKPAWLQMTMDEGKLAAELACRITRRNEESTKGQWMKHTGRMKGTREQWMKHKGR